MMTAAAAAAACILTLSALWGSRVVSGDLSAPTNVRLTSYNMNLVLRWDPPEVGGNSLVYTTEYKSSVPTYKKGCVNISAFECDFASFGITVYGKYTGRVQAQLGAAYSAWVESNPVTLDKDTFIGPPSVSLFSHGQTLEVSIKDPVFMISTLRDVYKFATYNITYWKSGQNEKARSISNLQQNRVTLGDLDPWSKYCVQVQINTDNPNPNPSKPSSIICESTTKEEAALWVAAVVVFVIMAVAVALVLVIVVYRRSIFQFLCLKEALPHHLEESLLAPPTSTMYLAMRNSHPVEEIYHQVSIVARDSTVKEGGPLEAAGSSCSEQPDITVEER